MKSSVLKRSIVIAGHKTSVSLEDAFWRGLKDIALTRRTAFSKLVAAINSERGNSNLSSAIRVFVLDHYRARSDSRSDGGNPLAASENDDIPERHEPPRRAKATPGPGANV
jgi:predicted DNA-binding ribbon-helix-helix protein